MCDYGIAKGSQPKEVYLNEMNIILEGAPNVQYLLLCSNGSIMDESQLSEETFRAILEKTSTTTIPNIIIETHYQDITVQKLDYIKKTLYPKNITIEFGLETINPNYQDALVMKGIIIDEIEKTIKTIQQFGMSIDINIMLGLPFLSVKEQLNDSLKTVKWVINHDCNPVIFPLNIKPYTLLYHMYQTGHYSPISLWLIIVLLSHLKPNDLEKITISYYGNRTDEYLGIQEETIYPYSCPKCHKRVMEFFEEFFRKNSWQEKYDVLNKILTWNGCNCLEEQKRFLNKNNNTTFDESINEYLKILKRDFQERNLI